MQEMSQTGDDSILAPPPELPQPLQLADEPPRTVPLSANMIDGRRADGVRRTGFLPASTPRRAAPTGERE